MSGYQRNGRPATGDATANPNQDKIRINGYQQVLDLLRVADPEFRESLLRRLALQDPKLASQLRKSIANTP